MCLSKISKNEHFPIIFSNPNTNTAICSPICNNIRSDVNAIHTMKYAPTDPEKEGKR